MDRCIWWGTEASCLGLGECTLLEVDPPASVEPSDDCSPGRHLDCNLMRHWARTAQSSHTQIPDLCRQWINKFFHFNPLFYGNLLCSNRKHLVSRMDREGEKRKPPKRQNKTEKKYQKRQVLYTWIEPWVVRQGMREKEIMVKSKKVMETKIHLLFGNTKASYLDKIYVFFKCCKWTVLSYLATIYLEIRQFIFHFLFAQWAWASQVNSMNIICHWTVLCH